MLKMGAVYYSGFEEFATIDRKTIDRKRQLIESENVLKQTTDRKANVMTFRNLPAPPQT